MLGAAASRTAVGYLRMISRMLPHTHSFFSRRYQRTCEHCSRGRGASGTLATGMTVSETFDRFRLTKAYKSLEEQHEGPVKLIFGQLIAHIDYEDRIGPVS